MKIAITAHNIKKSFNNTEVFQGFSIDVEEGAITAIIGPNGCGKSTLLNILAGVTACDSGNYHIEGFDQFEFSYIFQNYRESLLPWRTNFENVALPLEIQGKKRGEIRKKIEELQRIFELEIDWEGYPYELSGGQQQILAFVRALVVEPKVLFIDEPFSALDYENNLRLREHLQKYFCAFKPTIVLITHNIEEATHCASKVLVLSKKPTNIIEKIDVLLPYPRTIQDLKTEQFHQIKNQVLSSFQKVTNI